MTVLAGFASFWGLAHHGIHEYYAAAAESMSLSWRSFWFAAFDSSGTITIDKLPGAIWVQALLVKAFGLNTYTLVTPIAGAGALCVPAMFVAVRRMASARVGVLAAAIAAVTPATTVMSRGNTQDVFCVLLLILATGATIKSIKTGRLRPLLFAALYVGLAFQTKMLEAWAILPGLAAAYLIAAQEPIGRRLARLGSAFAVVLAVSLAWMTAISVVPADQRPFVDGSHHNSVFEQVFIYNGIERFSSDPAYGMAGRSLTDDPGAMASLRAAREGTASELSAPAGWDRLIRGATGRDAGWLLPGAILAMISILYVRRRRPRTDLLRAGTVAWGSWLVLYTVALSGSQVLLSYYTGMLVPPIAAIAAVGTRVLWRRLRRGNWLSQIAVLGALLVVVGTEIATAYDGPSWLRLAVIGAGLGAVAITALGGRFNRLTISAVAALLLVGPVATTVAFVMRQGTEWDFPLSADGTYMQKYDAYRTEPASQRVSSGYGGVIAIETSAKYWATFPAAERTFGLEGDYRGLIFAGSEASVYVMTGAPGVVPIGGYTGLAPSPDLATVKSWLDLHKVRWVIVPSAADYRSSDPRIELIEERCRPSLSMGSTPGVHPVVYICGAFS